MSKSVSNVASQVARLIDRVSPPRHRDKAPTSATLTKEQEDEIIEIFKLFDVDRDGSVTKFELKEALWSLGQHPGEEEMDDIFTEYDVDRNGALDFKEFKRLLMDRLSYKHTRAEYLEAFRSVDRNKDGNIGIGELKRLMAATGFGLTDVELQEIFGLFDKDNSGKVDIAEFMDYMMEA